SRALVRLFLLLHGRILPHPQRERTAFAVRAAAGLTSSSGSEGDTTSTAARQAAVPRRSSASSALLRGNSCLSCSFSMKNDSGGGVLMRPSTATLNARFLGSASSRAIVISGP